MPRSVTPEMPYRGTSRDTSRAYSDVTTDGRRDPAALNNRGVVLERQGRYEEALAAFSAAILCNKCVCVEQPGSGPQSARPPPGGGAGADLVLAVAEDLDPQARALYPGILTMTRA